MSAGKVGSADLAAGVVTLLGTADVVMVVNVSLVNRGLTNVKVRVAIGTGGAPVAADYIEYDAILAPGGVLERTGMALSAGENLWVYSDIATVSARANGLPAA